MTPLDDELRRTLSSRAATLAPSPEPLTGIEARVSRIRRRRVALSVSGAVAAVAAVALAVPALVPDRGTGSPDRFASSTPSAAAQQTGDPIAWEYRGNDLPSEALTRIRQEWELRHPGSSSFVPLFGQVYEPSAAQELVYSSTGPDGRRVGVVELDGARVEFLYDERLGTRRELAFVLPGDEAARVLVVAAPDTVGITYRDSTSAAPVVLTPVASGVATGPTGATRPSPLVRVTRADGAVDELAPSDQERPANLLMWQPRGDAAASPSVHDLGVAFTRALGRSDGAAVEYRPLFTGDTDSSVRYTMGQAWFRGDRAAYTVSYATGGTNGPDFFLGTVTPTSPTALAFVVGSLPGTSVDLLVVVPKPGVSQVSYDDDATGAFRPADMPSNLDGVALIDRAKDVTADRLELLDGNGDLDRPAYRGPVGALLCGLRECG